MAGHCCVVTHASFSQINQFIFASTDSLIKQNELIQADADILIGGHCGLQAIDGRLWLNAGVIGLPVNDVTVDGWYLVMEPQSTSIKISWHRLQYDYQQCFQDMQSAGLMAYASCIKSGLWPTMDILPDSERSQQGIPLQPEDMIFSID